MKEPLISVIIPVYNVEPFLCRCVDSVLKQEYKNLEILLVDDGSNDNSGKICDDYLKRDSRIQVIHKENGGLSDARNAALAIFCGEYVTFVDSDDFVSPDYVSYLYELLNKNNADLSICALQFTSTNNINFKTKKYRNDRVKVYSAEEALEQMLYQKRYDTNACGKLYRRELFEGIRYPEGKLYEDLATTYLLFAQCRKIVFSPLKYYFYYQRQQSILNSPFSASKLDLIHIAEEVLHFTVKNYPNLYRAAAHRVFSANFHILLQIPIRDNSCWEEKESIENNLIKFRLTVLFDPKARMKNRIAALLSFLGLGIVRRIWDFIKQFR